MARRRWCAACVLSSPCKNKGGRTGEQGKIGFDQKPPKSIKKSFKIIIGFAPRRFGVFCAHTRGRRIEFPLFPRIPAHGWHPQTAKPRFCNCNPRAHGSPRVAHGNNYCSRSVRQAGPAGCFAEAAKHWRQTAPKTIMVALRKRAPCGSFGGNAGLRCRRSEIRWENQWCSIM